MRKMIGIALAMLFLSATAFAQMGPPGPPPPGPPGPRVGFGHGGPFGPGVPGMHPWKVVTDHPYSADMTEQSVETLPNNGGTITRTVTGKVARDPSGRTYVQQTFTGGPFGSQSGPKTVIFLTDPVAGYSYTLYPDKNVAIQRPFRKPPAEGAGERPRHTHPDDPNVSVQKSTNGDIETTTITRTVPANTIGNSVALTSTSTLQYSTSLQIVVSSTRSDPRFGNSTYTLSNIAPDAGNVSFSVPAGYTIQTESNHRHRGPQE